MPRPRRQVQADGFYHVLNRGNGGMTLFRKPADYQAFLNVLAEGQAKYPVEILAFCLMSNHWHLVLRPRSTESLPALMRWIGVTHVRRHHAHHQAKRGGHLYQGRFKSFPIQDDSHFLMVCRYVEANPLRAGMVKRAQDWAYSSLGYQPTSEKRVKLSPWPVDRPSRWGQIVNESLPAEKIEAVRLSVNRGRPFGDASWVRKIADRLDLHSTLRPRGRPRKEKKEK